MSLSAASLAARVSQEQEMSRAAASDHFKVLLLPPNLVSHARLALALAAAASSARGPCVLALCLATACIALDPLDGWLARRLGQQTAFGALYDVAIDNLVRALLWAGAAAGAASGIGGGGGGGGAPFWAAWAAVPAVLEGLTLACTHAVGGAAWKTGCFR
ncbi:hypothetical protein ABPG75_008642 [Micractinium tetrahymenae]